MNNVCKRSHEHLHAILKSPITGRPFPDVAYPANNRANSVLKIYHSKPDKVKTRGNFKNSISN